MAYSVGDRIRYINPEYVEHNSIGTVAIVDKEQNCYWVWLDEWRFPIAAETTELAYESGN